MPTNTQGGYYHEHPTGEWIQREGYVEYFGEHYSATVEFDGLSVDGGEPRYIARVFRRDAGAANVSRSRDGWPREFMSRNAAKREAEAWVRERDPAFG